MMAVVMMCTSFRGIPPGWLAGMKTKGRAKMGFIAHASGVSISAVTQIPTHSTLPCLFTLIIVCQPEVILLLFNHCHQCLLTRVDCSCWNSSLYHQPRSFMNSTSLSTADLWVPVATPLSSHHSTPLYHQPRSFINSTLLTLTANLLVPVVTPLLSHQSNAQSFCPQHLPMPGVHHNTSQWTHFFWPHYIQVSHAAQWVRQSHEHPASHWQC